MKKDSYPEIGIIIIGLNSEKYIGSCIEAVKTSDYPQNKLEIIYVDGGSIDKSIEIAEQFKNVKIIRLDNPNPSPGRGRNAGYKACKKPLIQFIDSDSYLQPEWLKKAIGYLKHDIVAVWGNIFERYPDKNWFHTVTNFDWGVRSGEKGWLGDEGYEKMFGGNVLIRREFLEKTGGFDEDLIAGEDPDLSYRVRQIGGKIYKINVPMVSHDINMDSIRKYNKRAYRTGYAYAQIGMRYCREKEKFFLQRIFRILLSGTVPLAIIVFSAIIGYILPGFLVAIMIFLRPLRKVFQIKKQYGITLGEAVAYCLHFAFVVYPQLFGVLRYFTGVIFKYPLQNKL